MYVVVDESCAIQRRAKRSEDFKPGLLARFCAVYFRPRAVSLAGIVCRL